MSSGHVWKDLERKLQEIRKRWLTGEGRESQKLSDLIDEIKPFITLAASRIVNSPRLRYRGIDPNDTAQRWWEIMLSIGFEQYDPAKGAGLVVGGPTKFRQIMRAARSDRTLWQVSVSWNESFMWRCGDYQRICGERSC
jgi:hypothetical protein